VDAKEVSFLHGIQITGTVTSPEGNEQKKWRDIYCSVYPRARLTKFIGKRYRIYALHIETAKLTDNSLGFGKSFLWDFRPSRADGVRQDGARGP
jgi:uncharacterized protein YhbP (UPF0306 family)